MFDCVACAGMRVEERAQVDLCLTLRQAKHRFARRDALGEQGVRGVEPLDLLGSR